MRIFVISETPEAGEFLADVLNSSGHCAVVHDGAALTLPGRGACDLLLVRGGAALISRLAESQWRSSPAEHHLPAIVISEPAHLPEELHHLYEFLAEPVEPKRLLAAVEAIAAPLPPAGAVPALSDAHFELFRGLLLSRTGLLFASHNRPFLERGLLRRMRLVAAADFPAYHAYLTQHAAHGHELQKLLQLITVGETYFFRYPSHFVALREEMQKKDRTAPIRCWSAGCSTGEEAYSIALAVMEALPDWRERDIEIVATDINRRSLKKGAAGVFSPWSLRGMDPARLERFFTRRDADFALSDEVKSLVRFAPLNLCSSRFAAKSAALTGLDAIFCRNVLIYLEPETAQRLVSHFAAALRPGGLLFLGHAEPFFPVPDGVTLQRREDTFFFRREAAAPKGAQRTVRKAPPPPPSSPLAAAVSPLPPEVPCADLVAEARRSYDAGDLTTAASFAAALLNDNPAAAAAHVLKGLLLAAEGRLQEARVCCRRALELDDLGAEGYFLSALLFEATRSFAEAVRDYGKVILLDPHFVMPRYRLGGLYLRLGRVRDAAREYGNALRILERETRDNRVSYSGGITRDELVARLRTALAQLPKTTEQPLQGAL